MALVPPPPDVLDLEQAPMAMSMKRNIPFLQLMILVEILLRIQFVCFWMRKVIWRRGGGLYRMMQKR